ncbi:hypothetical protein CPT34_33105 [Rhizobium sophoriradicis]|uniref:Uncharacterized protein n=1 Tax=Rhizobium sophoriradicis TaxID=1535245 RepID=A0A2A5KIL8_9HYPH|nr:hypothetical protein CPT34_33105 [Rhizobium sophoriradicis]
MDWISVASDADDLEYVRTDIDSVDRRWTRHIAFWHCNLVRFDSLLMRQEEAADHPINGDARQERDAVAHAYDGVSQRRRACEVLSIDRSSVRPQHSAR